MEPKPKLQPMWLPMAFCTALCAIALATDIATPFMPGGGGGTAWKPAFFSFLPMVFFFLAMQEKQSRQRIAALEARMKELEGRADG